MAQFYTVSRMVISGRPHDLEEPLRGPGLRGARPTDERVELVGELGASLGEIDARIRSEQAAVLGQAHRALGVRARHGIGAVDAVLQEELLAQTTRCREQIIGVGDRFVAPGAVLRPGPSRPRGRVAGTGR